MRETSANCWIKIIEDVMFLSADLLELTSDFLDHASSQNQIFWPFALYR